MWLFSGVVSSLLLASAIALEIQFPDDDAKPAVDAATTPTQFSSTTPIPTEVATVAHDATDTDSHVNVVTRYLGAGNGSEEVSPDLASRSVLPRAGYSGCRAPTAETGYCGSVRQCPGIYRIRDARYLRRFLCGYEGQTPLVCCPYRWTSEYFYQSQRPTTTRAPLYNNGSQDQQPTTPTTTQAPRTTTRAPTRAPTSAPTSSPQTSGQSASPTRPRKPSTLPEKCGVGAGLTRIVGGAEARVGDYPWMAAIYYNQQNSWLQACGGSLVSNLHVVTAAHCVVAGSRNQNLPTRLFLVRLGDHDLISEDDVPKGTVKDFKVAKISRHSQFNSETYKNDIALLQLETPVTFSKYIGPLCLPYDGVYGNLDNEYAIVSGWGYTKYEGKGSDVLKQAAIRIWPEKECKEAFKKEVTITEEYLCAGDGKQDSCQGDSGGPLFYNEGTKFYLIGVVSFGKKCATPGYPGAYTRVTKYLDWLNDHF